MGTGPGPGHPFESAIGWLPVIPLQIPQRAHGHQAAKISRGTNAVKVMVPAKERIARAMHQPQQNPRLTPGCGHQVQAAQLQAGPSAGDGLQQSMIQANPVRFHDSRDDSFTAND
jgi:hypothetical protein